MSNRVYTILTLISLLLALTFGFLYWQTKQANDRLMVENKLMVDQIGVAEQEQREAIIQRRISEQLENITREQKNLTEEQTQIAIEQRTIAEARQAEAVRQRQKADDATTRAVEALDDAENQRQIAVEQKDIAESERLKSEAAEKRADRLRQLALSQALSIQASSQNEAGNDELAAMLSTMGWKYAAQNNGDPYQSDLFGALKKASGENIQLLAHTDYARDIVAVRFGATDALFSASQNGELISWKLEGSSYHSNPIVKDSSYDFRELAVNQGGSYLAAGDLNGVILIIREPLGEAQLIPFELTNASITGLHFIDNERLLYSNSNGVLGMITLSEGFPSNYVYGHELAIRAIVAGNSAEELLIVDEAGKVMALDLNSTETKTLFELEMPVASLVQSTEGLVAAGAEDGRIVLYDRKTEESSELIGHQSMVNDLVMAGNILISVGYDQTVRLWNLASPNSESILLNQLEQWGYALCLMPDGQRVASAGADRIIRIDTMDPEQLASMVREKITRNFSPEEWQQFMGEGNPYQPLIDKE